MVVGWEEWVGWGEPRGRWGAGKRPKRALDCSAVRRLTADEG